MPNFVKIFYNLLTFKNLIIFLKTFSNYIIFNVILGKWVKPRLDISVLLFIWVCLSFSFLFFFFSFRRFFFEKFFRLLSSLLGFRSFSPTYLFSNFLVSHARLLKIYFIIQMPLLIIKIFCSSIVY